jgi:hypothetical protein
MVKNGGTSTTEIIESTEGGQEKGPWDGVSRDEQEEGK